MSRALLFAAALALSAPAVAAPPNIVVVMMDDLDSLTLQISGGAHVLPNIEAIAARGVRFSNSFATNPLCAPSRATYLTGRYPHNHGVLNNSPPLGSVLNLDDSSTVATALAPSYRTSHVGKYLNGYGSDPTAALSSPLNPAYVPSGWSDWNGLVDPSTYSMYGWTINSNGTVTQHGTTPADYQTAVLGDIAQASAQTGRPVFLTLTPVAPHFSATNITCPFTGYEVSWCAFAVPDARDQAAKPSQWNLLASLPVFHAAKPSFNEADVSDKPPAMQRPLMTSTDLGWFVAGYRLRYLSLLPVDDAVGKLAAVLGPNTVWIITSDNGWLNGEHRMSEKMAAYEESARVPLIIAGPDYAPGVVSSIVLNNDLAPTIRDIAGLPPDPSADGRSLVPLLQGTTPPDWRKRLLIEHWFSSTVLDVPTYSAVRTGPSDSLPNRLYVEYTDGSKELYDLNSDPYELTSVHASRPSEVAALHALLVPLAACGGGTCNALER